MRVLRINEQWIGMLEHGDVASLIKKTDKGLALRVVHFEADPDYKERDEKLVEKGFKFLLIEKKKDKGLGLDIETEMEVSEGGPRWNHTVRSVTRGSAADKAGFSPGQLLVKLNGFDLLGRDKKEFTSIARNFLSEPQISFIVAIPDFERRESSSSEESEPPSKRGKRVSEGRYSLDEIQTNGDHVTEENNPKMAVVEALPQDHSAEAPVPSPRRAVHLPKARLLRLVKASTGSYGISVATDQDIGLHYVTLVTKNQPGALAGLLVDDCIWEINGKPVSKADSVRDCMREQPRHVILLVTTKAEAKWFQDAGSRPDEFHAEKWASTYGKSGVPRELTIFADQEKMGFAFKSAATDTENNFGEHFITSVTQGGLAAKAGMEQDDVIVVVNGTNTEVLGHDEVIGVIQKNKNPVKLVVINRKLNQAFKRLLINPADGDLISELSKFKLKTEPTTSVPPPSYTPAVKNNDEVIEEEVIEEIVTREEPKIDETQEDMVSEEHAPIKKTKTRDSEREHRKKVVIAQRPRLLVLERENSTEPIGFEYSSDKQNQHFVHAIFEESAADHAGLLTNDRILEINGEEVSGYSRDEIDQLLKGENDIDILVVDEATLITLEERGIKMTAELARGIDEPEAIKTSGASVSRAASTKLVPLPNTPQPLPRLVLLKKKNQTFGIEIGTEDDKFGNNSHRLISIASSGPAAKTNAKIGDYLLEINEIPVAGKNHDDLKILIQNSGKKMVLFLADLDCMDWHFDRQRAIDPDDAAQVPLAEFDSSDSETDASSIEKDSFAFAGARKIAPVSPPKREMTNSSDSSDEEPPQKPSREARRTVVAQKSLSPPSPKSPTPPPKSPTPPPAEKTPTPPPVKSPSPVPVVQSAPLTRALSPVDFDSDPEPIPEPEPSSDEESPPPPPPAPPLSAFRPPKEQKSETTQMMGVPKAKDVPSISYIAAQAAEAANKRSLKKADGEIDSSTGNYGLDFARNEKKFGTVKRFKIPNHGKKIDIFGEPPKSQPVIEKEATPLAPPISSRANPAQPFSMHQSGNFFQGMPIHPSNQQNTAPRAPHKRAPSAQPSQMAPSVVGYPPQVPQAPQHAQNHHVFQQRAYYDDPRRSQPQFQQPMYQPAPVPEHSEQFRNHIPQYAQPPQHEQMAPAAQHFYQGTSAQVAPQQQAYQSQQPQFPRSQEYHQNTHHMHHPMNVGPGPAVGYAPSVIDQRSVSQAPPHQTNEKIIQYVIQLPRIHDQAMHTSAPAPQIIIK